MKKKLFLGILTLFVFGFIYGQTNFIIKGKLDNLKPTDKVSLQYSHNETRIDDSATLSKDGKFVFKGTIAHPVKVTLMVRRATGKISEKLGEVKIMERKEFYIDKGTTEINGDGTKLKELTITAGKTQKEYLAQQDQLSVLQKKIQSLQGEMTQYKNQNNEEKVNEVIAQLREVRKEMNVVEEKFIKQNPDSYVSFDLVMGRSIIINPETFEPVFNSLSKRLRISKEGKLMSERLAIAKRTAVGQVAMDFSQKTVDGQSLSLSSLKGKYVLLDFWASWCGPCRAENPNVLKAYNKFKDKNFEVLAVSLDENRDAWVKAIKDDGMPWIHVSDLKGMKGTGAVLYGVKAIPQNFLIDPTGRIVAKNLRGESLEKKLLEVL